MSENIYPDFVSGTDRWLTEKALDLVCAEASGYAAGRNGGGWGGGLGVPALHDLFLKNYKFLKELERKFKKGEVK